ncbi:MAG: hypothetical protein JF620_02910 [Mesorhizobium sp.]|nr:hypothetical protein [Mesorhizobium sp.]
MKKSTKLALAFVALAGAVGTVAYAENKAAGGERAPKGTTARLSKATSGTIGFDQFSDAMEARLRELAAGKGRRLTVAELADALEKARLES